MKTIIFIIGIIAFADLLLVCCFLFKKDVIDFVDDEETFEQQEVNLEFIHQQLKLNA